MKITFAKWKFLPYKWWIFGAGQKTPGQMTPVKWRPVKRKPVKRIIPFFFHGANQNQMIWSMNSKAHEIDSTVKNKLGVFLRVTFLGVFLRVDFDFQIWGFFYGSPCKRTLLVVKTTKRAPSSSFLSLEGQFAARKSRFFAANGVLRNVARRIGAFSRTDPKRSGARKAFTFERKRSNSMSGCSCVCEIEYTWPRFPASRPSRLPHKDSPGMHAYLLGALVLRAWCSWNFPYLSWLGHFLLHA